MCGLVGFITDEQGVGSKDRAKFLKQALIIDTLRGEDSTGVILVPHDNPGHEDSKELYATADWCKQVGDGYQFVNSDNYMERMASVHEYKFAVGHNRAATQGVVNADNAHPFQEGPITMVHNGTLRDDTVMPYSMDDLKVEVDSHAVCHNLAMHPEGKAGVEAVVSKLDGAFVLIWHDSRDDSLNIVRNSERPLHLVQHRYNKTIYFASEAEMLALLVARLKLTCYDEALYPTPGQYMKFTGGSILEPETHELDLYTPTYGNWQGDAWGMQTAPVKKPVRVQPKIMMNGQLTTIPATLTGELTRNGYDLDDQYQFIMHSKRKATNRSPARSTQTPYTVHGMIGGTGMKVRIDDVFIYNKLDEERPWCVRPIAISVDADGEMIMICKVVRFSWHESDYRCVMLERNEDPASGKVFQIGENIYGNEAAWYAAVGRDGCIDCNQVPSLVDEPFIEWTDDYYTCFDCQHKTIIMGELT